MRIFYLVVSLGKLQVAYFTIKLFCILYFRCCINKIFHEKRDSFKVTLNMFNNISLEYMVSLVYVLLFFE